MTWRGIKIIWIFLIVCSLIEWSQITDDNSAVETISTATEVESHQDTRSIPFQNLLYAKFTTTQSWNWQFIEQVNQVTRDLFEQKKTSAPGGYLVQETADAFNIVVSSGKRSTLQGFSIKQVWFSKAGDHNNWDLSINLSPQQDEYTTNDPVEGTTLALIRVQKSDLPADAVLHGISLTGL